MAKSIISMPPAEELAAVEDGFYASAGFPDTIGAVDGTLVRIARPHDFEGWISSYVPPGKHLLADAGYKIWGHMLTPFLEADVMQDPRKRRYNKAHSRTRIVEECAFGRLKNRFRVLLGKLEQKTSDRIC
ncbi:DDE superfamily endonuclease [Phytophthora infestans]|uniref:DDE superfamily endonuclease n=1 Tax=Phytophthora infestans TaxID=4787 RepID=A0A8S9UAA3_PHYIN|nr:DDE superfamily endonuclease [Phytophthora infestans]